METSQCGIGAQLGFILGSVDLDELIVDICLFCYVDPDKLLSNDLVHILYCLQNAFSHVDALVAITQFNSFVFSG